MGSCKHLDLVAYLQHPSADKDRRSLVTDLRFKHERYGGSMKETNGTLCVRLKNRDRPIEQEARDWINKHRNSFSG